MRRLTAVVAWLLASPALAALPDRIDTDRSVKDPVFAVLLSLVRSDAYGTLTRERLVEEVSRIGGRSRLPYRMLRDLERQPAEPGQASLRIRFERRLDLPVPYSILGYHPGSMRATQECSFQEWILGRLRVGQLDLDDVHVFSLERGGMDVDIDAWLDFMLGSRLDDTVITGVVVFRSAGTWYACALGHNPHHQPRSGSFDFRGDRILFPNPDAMKAIARFARAFVERAEARGHNF